MRKIFLFLFAAVLSIGTAWAEDIIVNDGEFMQSYGSWVIVGESTNYALSIEPYGFDPADPQAEYFCYWMIGDYYASGESTFTATYEGNVITLTGTGTCDWGEAAGTEYQMTISALLPDPNATPEVSMYFDVTAKDLQVQEVDGVLTLTATDKAFEYGALNLSLMLTTTETTDVYTISDAYIASQGVWGPGMEFAFVSGTLTKTADPDLGDVYAGQIIVSYEGMLVGLNVTLYYVEPKVYNLTLNNADVTYNYAIILNATHEDVEYHMELGYNYEGVVENKTLEEYNISVFENVSVGDYGYADAVTVTVDADRKITVTGTYVLENSGDTYTVTMSGTLPTYTITLDCPLAGVALTGGGTYVASETVVINAVAPAGWTFDQWTKGTTRASNSAQYDFIASCDLQLTANFVLQFTEGDNTDVLNMSGTTAKVRVMRGFKKENLYTISLPFSINNAADVFGTGTVVYEYVGLTKDETNGDLVIAFNTVSSIAAGKPYLIVPGKTIQSYLGFTVENATISNTVTPISYSVEGYTVTMTPVLSVTSNETTGGKYWLAEDTYLYNNNVAMSSLRALFTISSKSGMPARARVAMNENVETGFENITTPDAQVLKVIENGQLIIIRDGVKYNVQGQQL